MAVGVASRLGWQAWLTLCQCGTNSQSPLGEMKWGGGGLKGRGLQKEKAKQQAIGCVCVCWGERGIACSEGMIRLPLGGFQTNTPEVSRCGQLLWEQVSDGDVRCVRMPPLSAGSFETSEMWILEE